MGSLWKLCKILADEHFRRVLSLADKQTRLLEIKRLIEVWNPDKVNSQQFKYCEFNSVLFSREEVLFLFKYITVVLHTLLTLVATLNDDEF